MNTVFICFTKSPLENLCIKYYSFTSFSRNKTNQYKIVLYLCFFRIIRAMLPEPGRYWVGVTNIEHDGIFNLLDGREYDPSDLSKAHLYYWDPQEPNYDVHDFCVEIFLDLYSRRGLADVDCVNKHMNGYSRLGLCEICVD